MAGGEARRGSTTDGLPVAPAMAPALEVAGAPHASSGVDRRVVELSVMALGLAVVAALVSQLLTRLIALFTQLAFYGRLSAEPVSPSGHALGLWVLAVPVAGGLVVGLMARYGSKAIRGHGIPEAMEQVLYNQSRIPLRMTFLKPLSAAVAIGTGGPFGAEGPIIATGGALGSALGQFVRTTAEERKVLLAAGAAAGMAATFGAPVSAVLLAIELLLFEYRPRSLIPVALATSVATGVRIVFEGARPAFQMPDVAPVTGEALAAYLVVGALVGAASIGATRAVYAIEDAFERLPLHWMWWPALGGLAVGVVGYFAPRSLGVGYDNIEDILAGRLVLQAVLFLGVMKFISWSIALGSGTSGGTLAPLLTFGGVLGFAAGTAVTALLPGAHADPRVAALVGMAAMFAGASRALLASVVFAFEATRQPLGLLPMLGGATLGYLVSSLGMRHSIMTEKLARRGGRVLTEYGVDLLAQLQVKAVARAPAVTLGAEQPVAEVRAWLASGSPGSTHQGYPVVDAHGAPLGVVTVRDLMREAAEPGETVRSRVRRPLVAISPEQSLREAADRMTHENVGRLPVVEGGAVVGMLTRSDLLEANRRRLEEARPQAPRRWTPGRPAPAAPAATGSGNEP